MSVWRSRCVLSCAEPNIAVVGISSRTERVDSPDGTVVKGATDFLHLANGTSTTGTIHDAGIPGRSTIWADPLHEGPVPADASDEELLEIRARYLSSDTYGIEAIAADMRRSRAIIDDHDEYDEIVLWYEHDLFDQLNLIQALSHLAASGSWPKPVSLICIGSFPGRPRFKGLGELTAGELAPLFETRQPVSDAQYALAVEAWAAYRSPEPTAIGTLLATDTSALPYLAAALERHLEEFPSTADGLSRTERRLLDLAAPGPIPIRTAFPQMHDEETAFYIADSSFLTVVSELSGPFVGLLQVKDRTAPERTGGGTARHLLSGAIELTGLGREVLSGREDRINRCGIERWLGGVHLTGPGPHWRWDGAHERLVRA
jgi:hypothetical protein